MWHTRICVAICLCIVFVDIHMDSVLFSMCSLCIWTYCKWCQCVCLCSIVCILTSGPFISVFNIIIIRQRVTISVRLCDRLNVGVCFTHRSRSLSSHVRYVVYFMKISQRRALIPHRIADQLTGARLCVIASRGDVTATASAVSGCYTKLRNDEMIVSLVYTFYIYLTTYCNTVNILICLNQKYISSWLEVNIHSKLHIFADILRK